MLTLEVTRKLLGDMLRQPPLSWALNDAMWKDDFVFNERHYKKKTNKKTHI